MKNSRQFFQGARVLITGHTGFKGSWLSMWMSQLGATVCGISLDVPTEPSHFVAAELGKRVQDHRVDIRDRSALAKVIGEFQPDILFHLAAQPLVRRSYADPVETWETNTLGTVHVLEALRHLGAPCVAVLITSDKCYDNSEWVWGYKETDPLGGGDPYSASKGGAELAIRSYVRSYFPATGNIRLGVGRAGNVIGGGDWAQDRIVPDCMRAWEQGQTVSLRNPLATRPWQHVLEPLSGYISLAMALLQGSELHGNAFNFGPPSQQNRSVRDLVCEMANFWDRVQWEDISDAYKGPHESGLLKLNCDKALHYLGWHATWDFSSTVRETVLWYKNFYQHSDTSTEDMTLTQINAYMNLANSRGLEWAM